MPPHDRTAANSDVSPTTATPSPDLDPRLVRVLAKMARNLLAVSGEHDAAEGEPAAPMDGRSSNGGAGEVAP